MRTALKQVADAEAAEKGNQLDLYMKQLVALHEKDIADMKLQQQQREFEQKLRQQEQTHQQKLMQRDQLATQQPPQQ